MNARRLTLSASLAVILAGPATTTLSWPDQAPLVGSAVEYDVGSGLLTDLRSGGVAAGTACLASGLTQSSHEDARAVPENDGFYYLVRAVNTCGVGTFGTGRETLDGAFACP